MHEVVASVGAESSLVTVVTEPPAEARQLQDVGIVLLNSGWVHRVGPHRMSVRLARRMAASGFVSARFDLSGIGDSAPRKDSQPLEVSAIAETREVMDHVERIYGVGRFVVVGNCQGASIAYRTCLQDPRVAGAVMINVSIFDTSQETNEYITKQSLSDYYLKSAVRDPKRWIKFLTGQTSYARVARTMKFRLTSLFSPKKQVGSAVERVEGELRSILERGARLLFLVSRGDHSEESLKMMVEGPGILESERATKIVLDRADHLFTPIGAQEALDGTIEEWLLELVGNGARREALSSPAGVGHGPPVA